MKEMETFKHFCTSKLRYFLAIFGCPGQKLRDLSRVRDLKLCDLSRVDCTQSNRAIHVQTAAKIRQQHMCRQALPT